MAETTIPVPAQWTDDCQGKKDYDGTLVTLSTRYWPRGGGFDLYDKRTGEWSGNDDRPTILPHAEATIYLGSVANAYYDDAVLLVRSEFTAPTEAEVKAQVEAWAAAQFARITQALQREFQTTLTSEPTP